MKKRLAKKKKIKSTLGKPAFGKEKKEKKKK